MIRKSSPDGPRSSTLLRGSVQYQIRCEGKTRFHLLLHVQEVSSSINANTDIKSAALASARPDGSRMNAPKLDMVRDAATWIGQSGHYTSGATAVCKHPEEATFTAAEYCQIKMRCACAGPPSDQHRHNVSCSPG